MNYSQRKLMILSMGIHLVTLARVKGFCHIRKYKFCYEIDKTMEFFKQGLDLVANGEIPEVIQIFLDMEELKYQYDKQCNYEDMMVIRLIKRVLLHISQGNIDEFPTLMHSWFVGEYNDTIFSGSTLEYFLDGVKNEDDLKEFEQLLKEFNLLNFGSNINYLDFDIEEESEEELEASRKLLFEVFGDAIN